MNEASARRSRSAGRARRTVLLCDPACVLPFGHNVVALRRFRDSMGPRYERSVVAVCEGLPTDILEREGFRPAYRLYYGRQFPAAAAKSADEGRIGADDAGVQAFDPLEALATEDADALLKAHDVGPDDDVVFPHLDFYGVVGMLNAFAARRPDRRPRLLLRFIGVMETASTAYRDPLEELLVRVTVAMRDGVDLRVSAETPLYADRLAMRLGVPVSVTGYPDDTALEPAPAGGPFTFLSPGSARHDKGFADLEHIVAGVLAREPMADVAFVSQTLPDHELPAHARQVRRLQAMPAVTLAPSILASADLTAMYRASHAVLLPYAVDVYRWRGSAVLMEAVMIGRPALTYRGTAFADVVSHYGMGVVVDDRAAMVEAVLAFSRTDPQILARRAMQARHRYLCDNAAALDEWTRAS